MMYHFMFGLCGASAVAAAPSAGDCCSPLAASFFSSSCIRSASFKLLSSPVRSVSPVIVEQGAKTLLNEVVDDPKVDGKDEDRDDDHCCGGAHFLPRGRSDL